jgi:ABC-2 type transport system permease protein
MLDTRQTGPVASNATSSEPLGRAGRKQGFGKFLVDLKYLWLEQMLEVRTTWYWFVVFGMFMPLSMVFGFARIGSGLTDRNSLIFIISGAAIFSVATEGIVTMAQRVGTMKKEGMLVYYASLPISKVAFIMAIMFSRLIVALPGMLMPILVGPLLYNVSLEPSLWILILLPLTALALSAIGMVLGSLVNSLELVAVITNVLIFVLLMGAPVFIPVESLPLPMQIIGYLLPPTYAADALRHALDGSTGAAFYLDLLALVLMTLLSFYALARWLRWRLK